MQTVWTFDVEDEVGDSKPLAIRAQRGRVSVVGPKWWQTTSPEQAVDIHTAWLAAMNTAAQQQRES
jgi:hypothetical protein